MLPRSLAALAIAVTVSVTAFVTMPATAHAQSAAQALRNFGLLGTWATDCSRPAAANNFYTVYSASGGQVQRIYYNAPGKIYNQYTITEANILASNELRYVQHGQAGAIEVTLRKADNRILVWTSRVIGGKTFVQDGKYTDDGAGVVWQARCR